VHRARHLAKHLPAFGWTPIVVRANERHYTEALDPALARLVPETFLQLRTGAFPAAVARVAGVGDIGLRGYAGYRRALDELAHAGRIQAVLITGSPFYPMLLSRHVRESLGLPVVLDFQDPWVSVEGATRPVWSKAGMAHRVALALEPRAVRHANFITSVSVRQNDEMVARYPWLDRSRMAAIPIGGDPDDFEALRLYPPENPQVRLAPGRINLVYVGTYLPRAGRLVQTLFGALADLRRERPALAERIRLSFVGTSNQPSGAGGYRVAPFAEAAGVGDLVDEHPPRVPFLEALSLLANADGLLMIGSDEPHYTASKIYPNLMSGRPFLSLFHIASSAHAILSEAGGGLSFAFETDEQLFALRSAITDGLARLASEPESLGRADPAAYEAFTARSVAGHFAQVFDAVAQAK
jgi:hypothetical protein